MKMISNNYLLLCLPLCHVRQLKPFFTAETQRTQSYAENFYRIYFLKHKIFKSKKHSQKKLVKIALRFLCDLSVSAVEICE